MLFCKTLLYNYIVVRCMYHYSEFNTLIEFQSEVGWRVKGQSRRIVLAITDGDYHYALDGKVKHTTIVLSPVAINYKFTCTTTFLFPEHMNETTLSPIYS